MKIFKTIDTLLYWSIKKKILVITLIAYKSRYHLCTRIVETFKIPR